MPDTILLTGANRGIGLALTRELLAAGHRVIATARAPQKARELSALAEASGDALSIVKLDVTSDASVAAAAKEIGALDVLVNNAGLFAETGNEKLAAMDLQHFRDDFETNVVAAVRMVQAFAPLLARGRGKGRAPRIVNISSGAGSISTKTDSHYYAYSASKAALNMTTRAMAAELKDEGICVVAMSPGWVRTEMGGPHAPLSPEQSARAIAKTVAGLTLKDAGKFLERNGRERTDW